LEVKLNGTHGGRYQAPSFPIQQGTNGEYSDPSIFIHKLNEELEFFIQFVYLEREDDRK
jgi:hypothetical protein